MAQRIQLCLPDLGVPNARLSLWLVEPGWRVSQGDRVVEILAGCATVDLGAPVTGTLLRICVEEDDPVAPGDLLAEFQSEVDQ
jgi:pyruvate/2-oxoglutarate dehydrogenase complex dihydrolipoamide acyltransferase (E2) component